MFAQMRARAKLYTIKVKMYNIDRFLIVNSFKFSTISTFATYKSKNSMLPVRLCVYVACALHIYKLKVPH